MSENTNKTIYVNSSYSDSNSNGELTKPYKTIQAAIDAAQNGDTISVAAGTYAENLKIDKSIIIKGESDVCINYTTDSSDKKDAIEINGSNIEVTFKNINITHVGEYTWAASNRDSNVAAISVRSNATLTLDNCTIKSTGSSGVGLNIFSVSDVNIINNSHITGQKYGIHVDLHPDTNIGADIASETLTSFGSDSKPTLTISGSTVESHSESTSYMYALYLRSGANYTIYIKESSSVIGWCAIYTKPGFISSTINIDNSDLIGINQIKGPSNDFGIIVLEDPNNYSGVVCNTIAVKNNSNISNYKSDIASYNNQEYPIVFNPYSQYINNQSNHCNITKNTSVVNIENSTLTLGDKITQNFVNPNQNNTNKYENIKIADNVEFKYMSAEGSVVNAPLINTYAMIKDTKAFVNSSLTIQSAIDMANNGDIIELPDGYVSEDSVSITSDKSFSIVGNNSTISGLSLSVVSGKTVNISISAVYFTGKGLYIKGANDVTITGCTFTEITSAVTASSPDAIRLADCTGNIHIVKNKINDVAVKNQGQAKPDGGMGINISCETVGCDAVEISGNEIKETAHNAIIVQANTGITVASIVIKDNTLENWDNDYANNTADNNNDPYYGGRAIRIYAVLTSDGTSEVSENIFIKTYDENAVFVKNTGNESVNAYDNGNILKATLCTPVFKDNVLKLEGITDYSGDKLFKFDDDVTNYIVIFDAKDGYFFDDSSNKILCSIAVGTLNDGKVSKPGNVDKEGSYSETWYNLNDNKVWNFDTEITDNTTLYAKWTYTGGSGGGVPVTPPATETPVVKEDEVKNDDGTTSSITETTTKKENADGSKETTVEKKEEVKDESGNVKAVVEETSKVTENKDGSKETVVEKKEEVKDESGKTSSVVEETSKVTENKDGSKETVVEKKEEVKDESGKTQSVVEEKHNEVVSSDGSLNKTSEKTVRDAEGKVLEEKTEIKIEDKNTGVSTSAEIKKDAEGNTASEIKTETSVETKDGKAEVNSEVLDAAIKQAEAAKKTAEEKGVKDAKPVIEIAAENSEDFTETQIAAEDLSKIAEAEVEVKIKTAAGEVNLPPEVSKNISSDKDEKVSLSFGEADKEKLSETQKKTVGEATVFEFNLKSGDSEIHDLGGTAKVTVPYELKKGEDPQKITVYYIDDEGNIAAMNSVYDSATKSITFETSHFSYYFIAENSAVSDDKNSSNNTIYYAVAAIVIILIIIASAYYFMKKKQ